MLKPNRKRRNLFTGILGGATLIGCTSIDRELKPMSLKINAETVIQFLHHFEAVAMKEDFNLLIDMIDERAYFRFNDGDFKSLRFKVAVHERLHLKMESFASFTSTLVAFQNLKNCC
jgi:hypothetical protein